MTGYWPTGHAFTYSKSAARDYWQVHVDPQDLLVADSGQTHKADFTLTFISFTSSGPNNVSNPAPVHLSLNQPDYEAALRNGIAIERELVIPAGTEKVRIVVQDSATATTGSLTVPVDSAVPGAQP
jgi:hypothetical protein